MQLLPAARGMGSSKVLYLEKEEQKCVHTKEPCQCLAQEQDCIISNTAGAGAGRTKGRLDLNWKASWEPQCESEHEHRNKYDIQTQ